MIPDLLGGLFAILVRRALLHRRERSDERVWHGEAPGAITR
jgi:hypothetical protein